MVDVGADQPVINDQASWPRKYPLMACRIMRGLPSLLRSHCRPICRHGRIDECRRGQRAAIPQFDDAPAEAAALRLLPAQLRRVWPITPYWQVASMLNVPLTLNTED